MATVRYIDLNNVTGLPFYFKLFRKLVNLNKNDWEKGIIDTPSTKLTMKLIHRIF